MVPEQDLAEDARHAVKMAKKKAARDRMMAEKSGEKGLVIVHTGAGKGKSSSAFGMIMRCVAHGFPCARGAVHQGRLGYRRAAASELAFRRTVTISRHGRRLYLGDPGPRPRHRRRQAGWEKAKELIGDPGLRMVVLDEINIALRYDYLAIQTSSRCLKTAKPPMPHVVLTGRNAKQELMDAADLVTEMTMVKHPFRSGIKAQPGVEF